MSLEMQFTVRSVKLRTRIPVSRTRGPLQNFFKLSFDRDHRLASSFPIRAFARHKNLSMYISPLSEPSIRICRRACGIARSCQLNK
jgi:hypothetical protein